jgi:hypothetical protein
MSEEVRVETMTDEQIVAQLEAGDVKEETPTTTTTEETPQEEKTEQKEKTEQEEKTEVKEEVVTLSKTEYEKLQKRIDDKEKFIQKQAQEVGARRKSEEQLRNEIFALQQQLDNLPIVATRTESMELEDQIRDRKAQLKEAEILQRHEATKNIITQRGVTIDPVIDEIVNIVREDGDDETTAQAIRINPYSLPPAVLVNLYKRAELRQTLKSKESEIATLKAEVATLKGKPQEVVKKIEKALKEQTTMTNNSGQATATKRDISETQVHALSDKELEQALKESMMENSS